MPNDDTITDFNSWSEATQAVDLGSDEIHVWRVRFDDCDNAALGRFNATLSSDEKARADRLVFPRDRNAFIVTRGILRELLGRYLGCIPAEIEFDYGPQGKPSLREKSSTKSKSPEKAVQFNVSHSHGVALLAFSVARRVGVDVELVRPDFGGKGIAERYFSPHEVTELGKLPSSLRDEGFFLCWTRKEAYIKARGEGLHVPLESFRVSLTPGEPAILHADDSSRWSLRSLRPAPLYTAALVGEGKGWQPRGWIWKP